MVQSGPVKFRRTITNRADFRFKVPTRSDRKHSWAQHAKCDGYLYQFLRRSEHLAAMNDGFVYERTGKMAKHLNHHRQDDAPSRAATKNIKAYCREKGIISVETWGVNQRGHRVRGFYLARHEDCCGRVGGMCVCVPEYNAEARARRFQRWSENPPLESATGHPLASDWPLTSHLPRFYEPPSVAAHLPPVDTGGQAQANESKENPQSRADGGVWFGMPLDSWFGSPESLESYESCESKTKHDAGPSEKAAGPALSLASENQMDENERTTRDPSDALLTAARVLAREHGITTGINLAAYVCAHAINGTGEPPRTVSYYTTSAQGYLDDEEFQRTGNTNHHIHPEMIEDGLARLRRAAERQGYDFDDAIAQLYEMHEAHEKETAMPKTPAKPFCQPKPIPCDECGETFASAVELARHLPCQSAKRTLQAAA